MRAPDFQIRGWLEAATFGTLSTLSAAPEHEGWPFGSLVPYALDDDGRPLMWLAAIAEHTVNLCRDARASLLVHQPEQPDVQAAWRVTLVGRMRRLSAQAPRGDGGTLSNDALAALQARYDAKVGAAVRLPGFDLWRLEVERVRSIEGFGKMGWAGPESLRG